MIKSQESIHLKLTKAFLMFIKVTSFINLTQFMVIMIFLRWNIIPVRFNLNHSIKAQCFLLVMAL